MHYVVENRGTEEVPFGFVYLADADGNADARAYFARVGDKINIGGSGSGYWDDFTLPQLHDALTVLLDRFGLIPLGPSTFAHV